MSNSVVLAAFFAFLNVLFMFAGFHAVEIPLLAVAALFALVGLRKPGVPESERQGRVVAVLSIVLAALPLFKPLADSLILARMQAVRAKQTAPMYTALDAAAKGLADSVQEYRDAVGFYPMMFGDTALPQYARDGTLIEPPADLVLPAIPADPFETSRDLQIYSVGELGAMIVSAGQDGVSEFPRPDVILPIDGQPSDPLAPYALAGVDLRRITYDPTNGALGNGDIVRWQGPPESSWDETMKPLWDAWDAVDSLTPPPPDDDRELDHPLPEDDALTAESLLADGQYLGALAAASRAVQNRRVHENFWTIPQLKKADLIRAKALYHLGHYRTGADYVIDYLQNSPNDAEAHYWLGKMLYLGGRPTEARRHFAASFELDPKGPFAAQATDAWSALKANRTPHFEMPDIVRRERNLPAPEQNSPQVQQNQPPMIDSLD